MLRCPERHEEGFLVLSTGEKLGRMVRSGVLACPTCGREYPVVRGVVQFSGGGRLRRPARLRRAACGGTRGAHGRHPLCGRERTRRRGGAPGAELARLRGDDSAATDGGAGCRRWARPPGRRVARRGAAGATPGAAAGDRERARRRAGRAHAAGARARAVRRRAALIQPSTVAAVEPASTYTRSIRSL